MTDFFAPQATHNPLRWVLPVNKGLCVGPPERRFLFGGVGLAAAVSALERSTDRPLVWATAQYLSYANPGAMLDIDVQTPVAGNNISQARVVGHVGEREIFTVNAALGKRDVFQAEQFAVMPSVPGPQDCDPVELPHRDPEGLHGRFEHRGIPRSPGEDEGRSKQWIRLQASAEMSAGLLAVIADYVPAGTRSALNQPAGANSLDNTLRVIDIRPADWVLCDTQIFAVANGFVHGRMHIFSADGHLLATASQSGILRLF